MCYTAKHSETQWNTVKHSEIQWNTVNTVNTVAVLMIRTQYLLCVSRPQPQLSQTCDVMRQSQYLCVMYVTGMSARVWCMWSLMLYRRYNTILYNTVQYCTILYNTVQYFTILYITVQYFTVLYSAAQLDIVL